MNTKRWAPLIVLLAIAVIALIATRFVLAIGFGVFPAPTIRSDVPVTGTVGLWRDDDKYIAINEFTASTTGQVTRGLLNANQEFVVEYHIVGTLVYDKRFRPSVSSVFVSDRFQVSDDGFRFIDVQVLPRLKIENDKTYDGGSVPFDIRVQKSYRTYQWGPNEFRAKCGDRESVAKAHQTK